MEWLDEWWSDPSYVNHVTDQSRPVRVSLYKRKGKLSWEFSTFSISVLSWAFSTSSPLNLLFSTSQSNFNLHHFKTTVWLSTCPRSIPSRAWPVIIPFRALMFTACQISDLQLLWDHNLPWTKAKVWWCISISGSSANHLFRVFFYDLFRALSPTEPWPSPTHGPTERAPLAHSG